MRWVGVLVFVLCAGCQDQTTGVQTLCNAPRDCAQCQGVEPAKRDQAMAKHIERSVRNAEARALFDALSKVDDGERAKLLAKAAEDAGLSGCILADRYKARHEAWEAHQGSDGAAEPE
ncbi:MAG: hypothetical protein ACE37F_05295 [Nannocystaceae bacterium]|nr:hypothetical protein [bacterium]